MLRPYFELMRLPNVFTALADAAMGFLFVREVSGPADYWLLALMAAASAFLYTGGMVLNDVFDVVEDARIRPERPIPSGRVSIQTAERLGWTLLIVGVVFAWLISWHEGEIRTGLVGVMLGLSIVFYDLLLKKTPIGPIMMGSCRSLNILMAMSVSPDAWGRPEALIAVALGIYITGLTWYARTEEKQSRRPPLVAATLVILVGIGLLMGLLQTSVEVVPLLRLDPARWYLLIGFLGIFILFRFIKGIIVPDPEIVQTAVGLGIMSLIMLDASIVFAVRGIPASLAIILLLLPAMFFGRRIAGT